MIIVFFILSCNYSNGLEIIEHLEDVFFEIAKKQNRNPQVEFKKYINMQDDYRRTSLHMAIKKSKLDLVKYLVENGIDFAITDSDGDTPLVYTIYTSKNTDIIKYLIEKGATFKNMDTSD